LRRNIYGKENQSIGIGIYSGFESLKQACFELAQKWPDA